MQLIAINTDTRNCLMALRHLRILSVLFLIFSGIGVAEATPDRWETSAQTYVQNSGSFSCVGCHGATQVPTLTMSAPSSVPFNDSEVELELSGFGSPDSTQHFAFWQYQAFGSSGELLADGNLLTDVSNATSQTINFDTDDDQITVRYCLLDGAGTFGSSDRFWNCGTETVTRDARLNEAPSITSSNPGNQSLETGGSEFNFTVTATDDSDTPTISATSSNTGVVSVSSSAANSFTLSPDSDGQATITITARDTDGETATQTFRVAVTDAVVPNEPPRITSSSPGNRSLQTGGSEFNFTVTATDDSDTPTISATSSNTGVVSVSSSAANSFTLSPDSDGQATITITARDTDGETATQTFRVVVTDAVVPNEPPRITSSNPGNQSLETGGAGFRFTVTTTDDNGTPTLSVTSSNTQVVSVSNNSGASFTLSPDGDGQATITVTARDTDGETDNQTFSVEVQTLIINQSPNVVLSDGNSRTREVIVGDILIVEVSITDEQTESLSYTASSSNSAVATSSFSAPGTLTINAIGAGTATITLSVTDVEQLSASLSVDMLVSINNIAPVARADTFVISNTESSVVLDVLLNDSDSNGDALNVVLASTASSQGNTLALSGNSVSYQVQGALTSNDFFSYRAADTSGALSESVVVSLIPSDQDGDGVVDALDNCTDLPNSDQSDMDSDLTGDLCDIDPDGDGTPGIGGIAFESGRELVEAECLACHLTGASGAPLFGDADTWDALIQAAGGQPEDLLTSVLNGKGSMPAFSSAYSTQELLQSIRYLTGRESTGDVPPGEIVDRDLDGVADDVDNCPTVPNSDQLDGDNNSLGDVCEPLADRDGDGIPFSLDDDDSNGARLLSSYPSTSNSTVFTSANVLRLGQVANAVAQSNGSSRIDVVLSESEFAQGVSVVFPGITVATDVQHSTLMGVISLGAQATSGGAEIIIQLSSNLPLNSVIRLFDTGSGQWSDFSIDTSNNFASAPSTSGGCPIITSANYQAVLTAGLSCIRLNVQDGGANDADGIVNSQVELIIDIARKVLDDGGPVTVVLNPSKGGGGSVGPLILIILLMTRLLLCTGSLLRTRR
jgi:cytochrome c5